MTTCGLLCFWLKEPNVAGKYLKIVPSVNHAEVKVLKLPDACDFRGWVNVCHLDWLEESTGEASRHLSVLGEAKESAQERNGLWSKTLEQG